MSDGGPRWPLPADSRRYDPGGLRSARLAAAICFVAAIAGIVLFFVIVGSSRNNTLPAAIVFAVLFFGSILFYNIIVNKHADRVAVGLQLERRQTLGEAADARAGVVQLQRQVRTLEGVVKDTVNSAIRTGDIVINGQHAALVIGSGSITVVNNKKASDPQLAQALTAVLGHIENLRDERGARFFGKFTEELAKPKPDKTALESFWGSVVSAVPTIKSMVDVVATITKLFV